MVVGHNLRKRQYCPFGALASYFSGLIDFECSSINYSTLSCVKIWLDPLSFTSVTPDQRSAVQCATRIFYHDELLHFVSSFRPAIVMTLLIYSGTDLFQCEVSHFTFKTKLLVTFGALSTQRWYAVAPSHADRTENE